MHSLHNLIGGCLESIFSRGDEEIAENKTIDYQPLCTLCLCVIISKRHF
jgi:hypothetical protein